VEVKSQAFRATHGYGHYGNFRLAMAIIMVFEIALLPLRIIYTKLNICSICLAIHS